MIIAIDIWVSSLATISAMPPSQWAAKFQSCQLSLLPANSLTLMLSWPAANSSDLCSGHELANEDVSHCIPSSFRSGSFRTGARATVRFPVENLFGPHWRQSSYMFLLPMGVSLSTPLLSELKSSSSRSDLWLLLLLLLLLLWHVGHVGDGLLLQHLSGAR